MSNLHLKGTPTEEVVSNVNKLGLEKAAKYFGTSKSSLSRWLNEQGYKAKPQYIKEEQSTQRFQHA